jgi:hypothetical protein
MKYLKKLITKHISIDEEEWDELTSKFSLKEMDNFLNNADKKWEHLARIWLHDTYFSSTYKRVKSYHIATFLGVAPQTLSKLKK